MTSYLFERYACKPRKKHRRVIWTCENCECKHRSMWKNRFKLKCNKCGHLHGSD